MENNFFLKEDQVQETSNSINSVGGRKKALIQSFKSQLQNAQ